MAKIPNLCRAWLSGHGVAQTVRIGKAIADDLLGTPKILKCSHKSSIKTLHLGRVLAPLVIPMKGAYGLGAIMNPGKMVASF